MAKAVKVPAKTEVVEVEPEKITLELTVEEASYLALLTGKGISGGPLTDVFNALHSVAPAVRKAVKVSTGYAREPKTLYSFDFAEYEGW